MRPKAGRPVGHLQCDPVEKCCRPQLRQWQGVEERKALG